MNDAQRRLLIALTRLRAGDDRPANPYDWETKHTIGWLRSLQILTDEQLDAIEKQGVNGKFLAIMATDPLAVLTFYKVNFKLTSRAIERLSPALHQLQGDLDSFRSQLLILLIIVMPQLIERIEAETPRDQLGKQREVLRSPGAESINGLVAGNYLLFVFK